MKTLNVKITDDMIRQGIRGHCGKCPIALAITAIHPDARDVTVASRNVYVRFANSKQDSVFPLSLGARAFIKAFDKGLPVCSKNLRLKESEIK